MGTFWAQADVLAVVMVLDKALALATVCFCVYLARVTCLLLLMYMCLVLGLVIVMSGIVCAWLCLCVRCGGVLWCVVMLCGGVWCGDVRRGWWDVVCGPWRVL